MDQQLFVVVAPPEADRRGGPAAGRPVGPLPGLSATRRPLTYISINYSPRGEWLTRPPALILPLPRIRAADDVINR